MDEFFKNCLFLDNILKGIGQIMLRGKQMDRTSVSDRDFMGSWQCGVAVLLSTAAGTFIAMKLNYDKSEINAGLYGFSAALVGVALAFLFQTTILIWILIVLGGALAAVIQHFFIQKKIPVFTFPFIIITWILVFVLHHITNIPPSEMLSSEVVPSEYDDFLTCTNGFGEVIFQGGVLSGLFSFWLFY